MYTVYKHTTPSKKIYIGITCQSLDERWRNGEGYKGQMFYKAVKKYGWENIKHEKICEGLTKEEAEKIEIALINKYKSNQKKYGYNISNGGNSTGKHSDETKKKIGAKHKGKIVSEKTKMLMRLHHHDVSKENNPNYDRKFTKEQCLHMSIAHKGKQAGENNPMYGKNHTEETKGKIRNAKLGKMCGSENHKSKSIEQYTKDGIFVKKYECIREAQKALNVSDNGGGHISSCASGKLKTAYGYIWKYADGMEEKNRGLV